ncbi:juvenile hormone acid O-methyltransferase [Trichonephila inaurata madagascariensis]|uniref:Juvenile hormone acid O-methyltransferase n=1 Tax=Trichonephila inaurata madagascariensis TaxID=2747483 RepID=A0A8X7BVR6_9ARAC|nr:juvenile hormone acid O-methyltransferase [Trichonephila inaurata madagascariensis]
MNLEPELYSSEPMPLESLKYFLSKTLPVLGWNICSEEDFVLDAGCGPGGTTFHWILPLFPKVKKIFGMDLVPAAIESAKKQNSHPLIEYSVANFEDWSTLKHWEGQITKLISVYTINWLKDQRNAFQSVFRLLKKGGEAAVCFPMQTSYYDALLKVQNSPKWSGFLKGAGNLIPESHYKKYDSSLYRKMVEEIGFEILYCRDEEITDVIPSEEKYRNFFPASCALTPHIPIEQRGEFKNDFIEELIKENGRNHKGLPQFRSRIIELVIRKN